MADFKYFLDRCLGAHKMPDALRRSGMTVTTMQAEGYPSDMDDVDWIADVAAKGWVILTKDKDIRRDTLELRAVLEANACYFTLGKADRTAEEMIEIVLHHRATIERMLANRRPPIVAQINKGEVLLRRRDGTLRKVKRRRSKKD